MTKTKPPAVPKPPKNPRVRRITGYVAAIAVKAANLKIISREGYKQAAVLLKATKAFQKEMTGLRTGVRQALDRAKEEALAQFATTLAKIETTERQLKDAMLDFDRRESAVIAKQQVKLDRQTNKRRDKLEARAAAARKAGKEDKAADLEQQARETISPTLAAAAPHVRGIAVRETFDYEVTDESKLPRQYLQPNHVKIRQTVQAMGADTQIEGVRVFPKTDIAAKSE